MALATANLAPIGGPGATVGVSNDPCLGPNTAANAAACVAKNSGTAGGGNAPQGVTNFLAGVTWGRASAFILGILLVGLGVWGLLGSGTKQTIVELGKGVASAG